MFPQPYLVSSAASSLATLPHIYNPSATLTSLPAHILLKVIYHCFPRLLLPTKPERQRKTLYWLTISLRLVSRKFYIACMHILRSTYLSSYQGLIRPPYTSDPFPFSLPTLSPGSIVGVDVFSPLVTLHRETTVLDRFIALKVRQDVLADESELHLDREDSFKDLFDVAQPRARLEDLVRVYGVREGVVSVPEGYHENESQDAERSAPRPAPSSSTSNPANPAPAPAPKTRRSFFSFGSKKPSSDPPPTQTKIQIQPIPFPSLSISFSPRQVGLVLNRSRTMVEVPRRGTGRNRETLEVLARALVGELKVALGGEMIEVRSGLKK